MSRHEKLISRLLSSPRDFTWGELIKVLAGFGYAEVKREKRVAPEENLWTNIKI
jgi:hypothetical protein